MPHDFIEQFKKMQRAYERVKVICSKIPTDMGDSLDKDDVLSFFQSCHHLKEWIINDKSHNISADKVENLINSSEYLKICADLCIGSKHLEIKNPRIDKDIKINSVFYLPPNGHVTDSFVGRSFQINCKNKDYDALQVAEKCLEEWQNFFNREGYWWN